MMRRLEYICEGIVAAAICGIPFWIGPAVELARAVWGA
jgi:hypothetical protein